MAKEHDIGVLNSLIVTTIDSALGFEESAQGVQNRQFEAQFRQFASERRQLVGELMASVRQLGGTPEDDGSAKAAAHRRWVDFKAGVTGTSDKAVIAEVNKGETYIREKYETALGDDELLPETRSVIENGLGSVRAGQFFANRLDQALSSGSTAGSVGRGWGYRLAGVAGLAGAAYAAYRVLSSRGSSREPDKLAPRQHYAERRPQSALSLDESSSTRTAAERHETDEQDMSSGPKSNETHSGGNLSH